jgi:7-carboxy-7-deazaguanine synthase (Cx14CxxC type)
MYVVKEIFYTLQGEGYQAGRTAVFCRFSGCNLWTGREDDRHKAVCKFCDTDFHGVGPDGGKFASARDLATRVSELWPDDAKGGGSKPYVVCTGGEPLLQLDESLVDAFHAEGFEVAVETNGTQPAPRGLDWICVSPKANAPLTLFNGDELKLVYPQVEREAQPECFEHLSFRHFSLQPMDGPSLAENIRLTVEYCLEHPRWRLSLQTHKLLGLR